MKKFLLALALILLPSLSFAANHYVTQSGSGSQNGSDWSNAYSGLPSSLTRGDVYVVAGGSYGNYTFDDVESGTSLITIRKASDKAAYRDDLIAGWNSAYQSNVAIFGSFNFTRGYYRIDGVTPEIKWATTGHGFRITSSGTNYLIHAGDVRAATNVTIRNSDIENTGGTSTERMNVQTVSYPSAYWTFEYNYFHNGCVQAKIQDGSNNWLIQYNYFGPSWSSGNCHGGVITFWSVQNTTIRYNYFDLIGTEGTGIIGCYDYAGGRNNDNQYIYGNVFYGSMNFEQGGNGTFYNGDSSISAGSYDGWVIVNNTFIGVSPYRITQFGGKVSSSYRPTNWTVKYNLFYNTIIRDFYNSINATTSVIDYNYYTSGQSVYWTKGANAVTSGEALSALFPNFATGNYHLGGDSDAVDMGGSMSAPYNIDADGYTRPQGASFDAGMYEYLGVAPPSWTVTAAVSGGNGSLACVTPVLDGNTTTCTATPNANYHTSLISGCNGSWSSGNNYTTGAITADCTVTATFAIDTYTVSVLPASGGSITPSTPQIVNYGSTAQFLLTPDAGYEYTSSSGCGGSYSSVTHYYTTAPVTANCTVSAVFSLIATETAEPKPFVFGTSVGGIGKVGVGGGIVLK